MKLKAGHYYLIKGRYDANTQTVKIEREIKTVTSNLTIWIYKNIKTGVKGVDVQNSLEDKIVREIPKEEALLEMV